MKRAQAEHYQRIVDLDGGGEDGTCKREDCWNLGAGVVVCYVYTAKTPDNGRCTCDHLEACHPPLEEGKAAQDALMRKLTCGHPFDRVQPDKPGQVRCCDCNDTWSTQYEDERQARRAKANGVRS